MLLEWICCVKKQKCWGIKTSLRTIGEQRLHDTQESRIIYRSPYISNLEISGETPFSYNSLAREESRTNTNNAVGYLTGPTVIRPLERATIAIATP
jgi:hypothetical protein